MAGILTLTLFAAFGLAANAAQSAAPLRIALVSDTHTNEKSEGEEADYRGRFDRVIEQVNAEKVDLVLVAGDLTNGGKKGQFDAFKRQVKGFHAPVRWVPGNHDVGDKSMPGKQGGITPERLKTYEEAMGPSFFAATVAGIRVVAINSSLAGSGLPEEAAQWKLLERELGHPVPAPTVLLMHYPLFVKEPDEAGGDYFNLEPGPRARLAELIRKGAPRAVVSGHLHFTLRHMEGSIPLIGTHPVSFGLPKGKQREGWTLVTIPAAGEVRAEERFVD